MLFAYEERPGNCPVIAAGPDNIFVLTVDSLLPFCNYKWNYCKLKNLKSNRKRMTGQKIER